jgi:malate permease and related proteins
MESFFNSISAVLLILMLITVGYILGRLGFMKKEHKSFVTKLLINFAVPCMCIHNIFTDFSLDLIKSAGALIITPTVMNTVLLIISYFVAKAVKVSKLRFGGFMVMCGLSNSLFVGYPVCTELFGSECLPYVMCFYMMNTFFFWSVGSTLIYISAGEKRPTVKDICKKLASPPLIALLTSVLLVVLGVKLPSLFESFTKYMGNLVSPLALIYIGFLIYETGLKNLRPDKGIWVVCGMRFIVAPLTALLMCRLFGVTGLAQNVFMIEAAMPAMTQCVVVSAAAGADEKYTALGMGFSSILCLVAVPILMFIFG